MAPVVAKKVKLNRRVLPGLLVFLFATVPILTTKYPPATDLPQHIAQVRLLVESVGASDSQYTLQLSGPDNLIYLIIFIFWSVLPTAYVAQAVLISIVFMWIIGIHGLAGRRNRSPETAVLASVFIFNLAFYWGFLNFLVGFPVFIAWFLLTTRDRNAWNWKHVMLLAMISIMLYESHALWFVFGATWFLTIHVVRRVPLRALILRTTVLLPGCFLALMWYPGFSAARAQAGFDTASHWFPLYERLDLVDSSLGGIKGPTEILILSIVFGWLFIGLWQNRKSLKNLVDREILIAAGVFILIYLFAPDKYMNTIFFNSRWLPVALILVLIAVPPPTLKKGLVKGLAFSVVIVFFMTTAFIWFKFSLAEMTGFGESLEKIAVSSKVLGLDFVRESDYIKGRPFLQMFAYSQLFKGGELNFSFAEHSSGLVAYKEKRQKPWTSGLEWYAERVRASDFHYFDAILVNGDGRIHQLFSSMKELKNITDSGMWRLYRVVK